MMTLRHPNGPRWLFRGLGGGFEAGGVFFRGKVTAHEKADIVRGIFSRTLKIWGRPPERLLLDSKKLVGTPSHRSTYDRLLQVSSNLRYELAESLHVRAGPGHKSVHVE